MRPAALFPLFADASTLPGVGAKTKEALARLYIDTVRDLLYHLPASVLARPYHESLETCQPEQLITTSVTVQHHVPPADMQRRGKRQPYKVTCYNPGGFLTLIFFHGNAEHLTKQLTPGSTFVVSGILTRFDSQWQMAHPDYLVPVLKKEQIPAFQPIYPLTYALSQKYLANIISHALKKLTPFPEWISDEMLARHAFPPLSTALTRVHHPASIGDASFHTPYRERLAYDELLANQLALRLSRYHVEKEQGHALRFTGDLAAKALATLGFAPTEGQAQVMQEIRHDQQASLRMMRLLQGDVGSGKTLVALCAMLNAVEAGTQGVLMAPTDLLAVQHFQWISKVTAPLGLSVHLLTGRTKTKERRTILEDLANGKAALVVGTHALFQDPVQFKRVGLIVIDEQHRFGVKQRMQLAEKGERCDMLLMTATPIPRTLTLALYGDMEVSKLKDKPRGRMPITTSVLASTRDEEVMQSLKRALDTGTQVYWVCPLIDENTDEEKDTAQKELAAAEVRYQKLHAHFGDQVGLLHGKMKTEERDKVMTAFAEKRLAILVATTVIEVGIDVPNANIIIIEQAERFGLAQLHQLRGRVGRGTDPASCILLYQGPLSEEGKARLKIMRETTDGFLIAEEDLRLRGAGELLGTKQSGIPEFATADIVEHMHLLEEAAHDAEEIMRTDPYLRTKRGEALRHLLYLFKYDQQMRYLTVG